MIKFVLPLLLILTACMEDNKTPEASLKSFIESRIGNVVTRESLVERTTGKMRQSLENVSQEDFDKFADLRNVKEGSFKVLSKSCQENRCFITYSIMYQTMQNDKAAFASEVKKIAEVVAVEGVWLIADVSNIKTYHEALNPISPLE